MLASTVKTLEKVQVQFAFFGFKAQRICFLISLATLAEFAMVF